MENNETWRDRFRQIGAGSVRFMATRPEVIAFFESELLTLADKIGAEKKEDLRLKHLKAFEVEPKHNHLDIFGYNLGLDTAISVIREMVK